MNRRSFTKNTFLAGLGIANYQSIGLNNTPEAYKYNLKYAPHLGMFRNLAGNDPIDQLNYIADIGFKAFEDNGMRNRNKTLQLKMASTMEKRDIEMGVFVAHKIYWKKPNLASGDLNLRDEFLNYIKNSIEVSKRVNAKWMTVVPGHVDLKQNFSYLLEKIFL